MIEKRIEIDGREYTFRSSALIPKLYRAKFGRDMVTDMRELAEAYKNAPDGGMEVFSLEIFERAAWIMLKHAGEDVGDDPDEWLMSLDGPFSVYAVLPTILELWNHNQKTTSVPKKG